MLEGFVQKDKARKKAKEIKGEGEHGWFLGVSDDDER